MEINALAVIVAIVVLVIGPGSGVWVGMRAAIKANREDMERDHKLLLEIVEQLKTLNGRVTKSEDHIDRLEKEN